MKVASWALKTLGWRRIAVTLLALYAVWLLFAYRYHFIDNVNLLVHEAGHVFFGFFGEWMGVAGGTLLQLLFPLAFVVYFLTKRQRFEAAVCGVWSAESAMYTARYMGDANEQVLPLVGGHIHDWEWLFQRANLLHRAEEIATTLHVVAGLGAIVAVFFAYRATVIDAPAAAAPL